jgi:F0F1-type ATP synthase membrane subunit c/vacuolar-type H+-ATPase subunit K
MKPGIIAAGLALALGFIVPANAAGFSDRATDRFEARQARQSERIAAGVAEGRIGERGATALARQQASLDRALDRRLSDGRLSVRDARALDRRFDRSSRAIRAARVYPRG